MVMSRPQKNNSIPGICGIFLAQRFKCRLSLDSLPFKVRVGMESFKTVIT